MPLKGSKQQGEGCGRGLGETLAVIENQEFVAMRAAATTWPALSTKEEELQEMANQGLIQENNLADWREPGEHRVPYLNPGEIVLFLFFHSC
jgi:hypothetical protein